MGPALSVDSTAQLKEYLREHGLAMQKRFGQNFLINRDAQKTLIGALELREGETVWEIGAGLGTMTALLLKAGARVRAFEIDSGFCAALREIFAAEKNFTLVEGDVLKTAFENSAGAAEGAAIEGAGSAATSAGVKLLGNLPYNIGARLLALFIENNIFFKKIAVTVQREVALRIAGTPGSKNYSSISVLCGYYYNIKLSSVLKGGSFYPAPNVDSQIVIFTLKEEAQKRQERPECFARLVRALFASRRKTVKNNLRVFLQNELVRHVSAENAQSASPTKEINHTADALLAQCSIKENERAENLSIEDFYNLSAAAG